MKVSRKHLIVSMLSVGLLELPVLHAKAEQAMQESERPFKIKKGKFLVATRNMQDPDFAEAVILILRFEELGAIGLVVNQQTSVKVASVLPEVNFKAGASMPVFKGGPVRMGVNALLWWNRKPQSASAVTGDLYLISDQAVIAKTIAAAIPKTRLRVYVGLCGWWPATQLIDEIRRGLWSITDADPAIVFASSPETVWPRLVRKLDSPQSDLGKK